MAVDLTGKVAVVTGGGGILCSAMAKALAKQGAKVAILDLKEESAKLIGNSKSANSYILGIIPQVETVIWRLPKLIPNGLLIILIKLQIFW